MGKRLLCYFAPIFILFLIAQGGAAAQGYPAPFCSRLEIEPRVGEQFVVSFPHGWINVRGEVVE
jgi:hypothetical protein